MLFYIYNDYFLIGESIRIQQFGKKWENYCLVGPTSSQKIFLDLLLKKFKTRWIKHTHL